MKKKIGLFILISTLVLGVMVGCSEDGENSNLVNQGANGGAAVSDTAFDIEVTYSDKEKLTVSKDDIDKYENIIKLSDETITISKSGEYVLEGTMKSGQIIVDVPDTDDKVVTLILNGVKLTNKKTSPIYVKNAKKVVLTLVDDTINTFSDGSDYVFDGEEDEPNGCIFSKSDLVISGNGTLVVDGNYNNGIVSKDDLTITGGNIEVNAVNNAIKGKDSVSVLDTFMTITSDGDGIKADNDQENGKGFVLIDGGEFNIEAKEDGIQAATCMEINGGKININAGDDGIHADDTLTITKGEINVENSVEGIEATYIVVNDGDIHIKASDDGFNAAGGNDSSSMNNKPGMNGFDGGTGGLTFNGGYIYVNIKGDGLDSNGHITINNGYIIVDGPDNGGNGAIDYGSGCTFNGGFLLAIGNSQMAQMPTNANVNSVMIGLTKNIQAGEIVNISDGNGDSLITFTGTKSFNNIVLCTESIKTGETYSVNIGGEIDGESKDGVYEGKYTKGEESAEFTVNSTITTVGNVSGGRPGMPGMPGGGHGPGGKR